eukprot:1157239-Pelagomonas_calceolata.AAC.4
MGQLPLNFISLAPSLASLSLPPSALLLPFLPPTQIAPVKAVHNTAVTCFFGRLVKGAVVAIAAVCFNVLLLAQAKSTAAAQTPTRAQRSQRHTP